MRDINLPWLDITKLHNAYTYENITWYHLNMYDFMCESSRYAIYRRDHGTAANMSSSSGAETCCLCPVLCAASQRHLLPEAAPAAWRVGRGRVGFTLLSNVMHQGLAHCLLIAHLLTCHTWCRCTGAFSWFQSLVMIVWPKCLADKLPPILSARAFPWQNNERNVVLE